MNSTTYTAIEARELAKRYRLGTRSRYRTLRESLMGALAQPFRRGNGARYHWALDGISFDVAAGEVVGIIGRNGAGKSTLLKILSRITEPTRGRAAIRGRVGSLLEVGTGFHPELTGRENIFLNGAVLGMRRVEIERKFEDIVAFAEIDKFLDTPVKRYSSGMYTRLAFAVAAPLEPEILLIDEVLAVGDAQFQKKCLGKMSDVAHHGRTVLFVSHNMQAVRQLCSRAIWLDEGKIVADGPASVVTGQYLQNAPVGTSPEQIHQRIDALPTDPVLRLRKVAVRQSGEPVSTVLNGLPLEVEIHYEVKERTTGLRVYFDLCDENGEILFRSFHDEQADGIPTVEPGGYVTLATIPADLLAPRRYEMRVKATIFNVRACVPEPGVSILLDVEATGRANRAYVSEPIRGKLAPFVAWTTRRTS
ncbi:MAG: ATP-binding cassette domain-containing protein [Acidobacteriota bacterium]|nr:MAG: ATP-binding cassette domain-containing protein [Acidobacteriota bacterium]